MYEQVFGLTGRPFTSTPYVKNYFAGESIHHALAQTRLSVERASGPVIVTGTSGTGKSMLLAMLTEHFKNEFKVVELVCCNMNERQDLLQSLLFELNLDYKGMSEGELRLSLLDHLKSFDISMNGILLLVDEAHSLSCDLLDELRLITNFSRDGRPVVSLVLAGTPSLEDHLIETKSESFNQRIAARCYLTNLGRDETFDYIVTHIERAGGNGEHLFTSEALSVVHSTSGGCPRIINQVCDYALVLAASQNSKRVTAEIANDAWRDVQSIPGAEPAVVSAYTENNVADHTSDNHTPEPYESNDGMMVIEFGELDSGSSAEEMSVQETSIHETELTICSVDDQVADHGFENGGEGYQLQKIEADYVSQETTTGIAQKEEPAVLNVVRDVVDECVSEQGCDTADASEPVEEFENPFEETFMEVEMVNASFVPAVSEQNLNSLMLTPYQLSCLDAVPTSHESPLLTVRTPLELDDESVNPQLPPVDNISVEAAIENNKELRLSAEGLASLERVEADIKRLQRDLTFSEQEFSSKAVHPDFSVTEEQEPLEEMLQQFPVVEPAIVDELVNDTVVSSDVAEVAEDEGVEIGGQADVKRDDDRDIMVISKPDRFQSKYDDGIDEHYEEEVKISTGFAQRMDYHDLFRQLRNAE